MFGLIYWLVKQESNTLIVGLFLGPLVGLIGGVLDGFTVRVKETKEFPNQGIKLSLKNALGVFFVSSSIFGVIARLIAGQIGGLIFGLWMGLAIALSIGLTFGLNRGGSAVINHYVLRLILWRNG